MTLRMFRKYDTRDVENGDVFYIIDGELVPKKGRRETAGLFDLFVKCLTIRFHLYPKPGLRVWFDFRRYFGRRRR